MPYSIGYHKVVDTLDEFAQSLLWLESLRDEEVDELILRQHERMLRERETGD